MIIKQTAFGIRRRELLATAALAIPGLRGATESISRPEISEKSSPAEQIWVETPDGNKMTAIIRKPPGRGPAPVMIFLHGGLNTIRVEALRQHALTAPTQCRALAAGYVTIVATFRDRSVDPQTTVALVDCLALVRYAKKLSGADPDSIAVYGCSGGGSLALEIAGEEQLAAIVCEEPATVLLTGMLNTRTPKAGERYSAGDKHPQGLPALMDDPEKYYTPELQKFTREKIRKIKCPTLIVRGDRHPINNVNTRIIIPEMKTAGKEVQEIVYPGEPHCFGFHGDGRIEAAASLFPKVQEFLRPRLKTQPKPIDASLVRQAPLKAI